MYNYEEILFSFSMHADKTNRNRLDLYACGVG